MKELYGYKKSDAERFIAYLKDNKSANLTEMFSAYSAISKKAPGSVRNMYYAIAKKSKEDALFCQRYFGGVSLKVNKAESFNEQETRNLIKAILKGMLDGKSVRRAIMDIAEDQKTALRYQNKYRNIAKNNQELLKEIREEIEFETGRKFNYATEYLKRINRNEYRELSLAVERLINRMREQDAQEKRLLESRLNSERQRNERLKKMLYKEITFYKSKENT